MRYIKTLTYHCQHCGAPTDPTSYSCSYCGSELSFRTNFSPILGKRWRFLLELGDGRRINMHRIRTLSSDTDARELDAYRDINGHLLRKSVVEERRVTVEINLDKSFIKQFDFIKENKPSTLIIEDEFSNSLMSQKINYMTDYMLDFGTADVYFTCGMSVPPIMMKRVCSKVIESGIFDASER